jgi:hypothetical protein
MCQTQADRWVLTPTETDAGYAIIRGDDYRVKLLDRDWACESWELRKETVCPRTGFVSYGTPYIVCLTCQGVDGADSCTCKGYEFCRARPRTCRHVEALRLLADVAANTATV